MSLSTFTDHFHSHFTRDPNECVFLGVDRNLDRLPDPSLAEIEARVGEAKQLVTMVDAIDIAPLSFDDRLDLELARRMLEEEIHHDTFTFNGRITAQQQPTAGSDIGNGLFAMFITDPRPAPDRLADMTARVEQVPEYLEALLARLDTPVARWVEIDRVEASGLPDLLSTLQGWADQIAWPDRDRLGAARARAEAAIKNYVQRLEGLPTTTQLHVGDTIARKIVALAGIDLSLEELSALSRDFLADTRQTIESLRVQLAAKHGLPADVPVDQLHAHLNRKYQVPNVDGDLDRVLDRYEAERERILDFNSKHDLFPVPDNQDMKILRTPGFMEPTLPAGAMEPPAPFRGGVRTSLVYLTLGPKLLNEHTELSIPGMMIHEGIPGHHLQLAIAAMHASVIRRHINCSHHAEGWTTMLEDYMLDQGYMAELTDEARFCAKRGISRIGARVAIDCFFMTGDRKYLEVGVDCDLSAEDPFAAAGSLLQAATGFSPGRVPAELNWYSAQRGVPLSYCTGNKLVWDLKEDATAAATAAGRPVGLELDRAFHRLYLESGNMPVKDLRRVMEHEGMVDCSPCTERIDQC